MYRDSDVITQTKGPLVSCINRSISLSRPTLSPRPKIAPWVMKKDLKNGAVCNLGVVIDHTYYKEIAHSMLSVAVSKVVQHVAEADFIFRTTDMDLDAVPDKIGFRMNPHITIYKSTANRMNDTSLNAVQYMNQFSSQNFDEFCLAVAFTCRDFGRQTVIFVRV